MNARIALCLLAGFFLLSARADESQPSGSAPTVYAHVPHNPVVKSVPITIVVAEEASDTPQEQDQNP